MEITIQTSRGCPHRALAEERVDAAVAMVAADLAVRRVLVDERDAPTGYRGSPTILIDGHDPFNGIDDDHDATCRMYRTERGLEGAPSIEAIRRAVEEAIRGRGHTRGRVDTTRPVDHKGASDERVQP